MKSLLLRKKRQQQERGEKEEKKGIELLRVLLTIRGEAVSQLARADRATLYYVLVYLNGLQKCIYTVERRDKLA